MEHVLVFGEATDANIINAINTKIGKYSSPKEMGLVVLSNKQSKWHVDSARSFINQKSEFRYVFVINLHRKDGKGFSYSVAMFGGDKFAKYNIQISPDFTHWSVTKMQK